MSSHRLLNALADSAALSVTNRRSILLLLEEEWHLNRDMYWSRLFRIMSPGVSGLSRTPFAQSLTSLATREDDLAPLAAGLTQSNPESSSHIAYRFACQYATACTDLTSAAPWIHLCRSSIACEHEDVLSIATRLLTRVLGRCSLNEVQLSTAASAAREILSAASERGFAPFALQLVVDTFDAARGPSEELLRGLAQRAEYRYADDVFELLTRNIEHLLSAPAIVALLYRKAVIEETAEESARRAERRRWVREWSSARDDGRPSPVPPMSPPRRWQTEWDYFLKQHVSDFLKSAPLVAVRAIVEAACNWENSVEFHDGTAADVTLSVTHGSFSLPSRVSHVSYRHHSFLVEHMLDALGQSISTFSSEVRDEVFKTLVELPASASVWATLIEHAHTSEPLLDELRPLLTNPAALRLFEAPVAALLAQSTGALHEEYRNAIAAAIDRMDDERDYAAKSRLEAVPASPSATDTGAQRRTRPASDNDLDDEELVIVDNDVAIDAASFGLTREELLEPQNATVRRATREVWNALGRLRPLLRDPTQVPSSLEEGARVLDDLRSALQAPGIAPVIETSGWAARAQIASLLLRAAYMIGPSSDIYAADVYAAALRVDGVAHPRSDLLNASQGLPRAQAVDGLATLASRNSHKRAFVELVRLSADREPSVRYQIAWQLDRLAALKAEDVWPLLVQLMKDENTEVAATATRNLVAFYSLDKSAALQLAVGALARFSADINESRDGSADALLQITWYHLAQANDIAGEAIEKAIARIDNVADGFERVLHSYRDWLTMEGADEAEQAARARTVAMFARIAKACMAGLTRVEAAQLGARWRADRSPSANLLEHVASQFYFASGAFRDSHSEAARPSMTATARFYDEIRDILVDIGTCGIVPPANRILETLEYFIETSDATSVDRQDAFRRFLKVAESAIKAGAAEQYWLLDPIERVLRAYVADRPQVLDVRIMAGLSGIIDPLLEIGWEQAYRLARDMDVAD